MALQPDQQPGRTIAAQSAAPPLSLDVVHDAVRSAVRRLAVLPGPPLTGWDEVALILDDFLAAVSPIERTRSALRAADPSGELADLVDCLAAAAGYLARGDVVAARAAIVGGAVAGG